MQQPERTVAFIVAGLVGGGLSLALAGIAGAALRPDSQDVYYPLHSLFAGLGAFAAGTLAVQLRTLQEYNRGEPYHVWLASALIVLGLLDAAHGAVHQDKLIVWLHSTGTLAGGLLFACVWCPARVSGWRSVRWLPLVVLAAATVHIVVSVSRSEMLPKVLDGQALTGTAKGLNLFGTAGFALAATYFAVTYRKSGSSDRLLLFTHCMLFGVAGALFAYSTMWDSTWWVSHIVCLIAYGIAVCYFLLLYLRAERELRESHDELERRVELRTSELQREVSQRKQAEEQIRRYAEELKRSNEDLEQFANMAGHDLSAPLRAVKGFCELLRERYEGRLDEIADEFIGHAVGGARRMEEMLNGLLSYSRIETRGKTLEPTDCQRILEKALANLRSAIDENDAVVTHDPLPRVMADSTQLLQLFQNLIGNAVKFRGEQSPVVHVSAKFVDGQWTFSVRDNGIGIDSEHVDRIFLIFQRLHSQEAYDGHGIGLAVCKRIVERHGGRLWVESEPGRGTTFYFNLPGETA